jgi:ATP-dependent helicase HrpB
LGKIFIKKLIPLSSLPITELFSALRQQVSLQKQIIIQAPTGAGKSTALPLEILGWPEITGRILMLEPRRVAARSVAQFVAGQLNQKVGELVGFRVRGESRVSAGTRLEIVTEGILTRMIQDDPELKGIDVIIFDEIHERHLTTDLGLALALEVQDSLRDDLTLIAMSATLTGLSLETLMPNAVKLESLGRSFKVELDYRPAPSQLHWLDHMGKVIVQLVNEPNSDKGVAPQYQAGALLAFLPGKGEIQRLSNLLSARLDPKIFTLCPLYGDLTAAEQDAAISPAKHGLRKIVLATNVAESSLTISDVTIVVDSGYKRAASFNPRSGVTRLSLKRISQASSVQRSGRAGRVAEGLGVRLWSQEEQGRMLSSDEPEIVTSELVSMALECAFWGARAFDELPLLTAPPKVHEQLAWELAERLELVGSQHKITELGKAAQGLGCHPRLAHMLLKSRQLAGQRQQPELALLACLLAGILEARGLPKKGVDISHYLHLATQGSIGIQVKNWQGKLGLKGSLSAAASLSNNSDLSLLLALAYPDRIAKARGKEGFVLSNGSGVTLDPQDALVSTPWLVVADFQETQGRTAGRVYLATALDLTLFDNELKYLVEKQEHCGWDEDKGRFFGESRYLVGQILLRSQSGAQLSSGQRVKALLGLIRSKGLGLLNVDDAVIQLQNRVELARHFLPELGFPPFSDAALMASLEDWLAPYLNEVTKLTMLAKVPVRTLLGHKLTWEQTQALDELAPTHWPMATGTRAPIEYQYEALQASIFDDGQNESDLNADENCSNNAAVIANVNTRALLSVRLQEAYGLSQSPMLFKGKLAVTMSLLSPGQRPLALTSDLASFWQGPYVEVKKEMRGRYPKHLWPDDPINTSPTKFTKKKTPGLNR